MTFNDILHKFRSESFTQKDKGTQFERLMRSWLLSDPRYSNLTKVWLWDDFPSRADLGGKDTGIDLVARTEEGDYWAIQCKCYKEDSVIDKPAVDSFLATSSRQFKDPETLQTTSFAKRMWISTTNHWGKNAEDAIQNQNPPFNRVGLVDLQNSPVDWQLLIDGLKGKEAMLPGNIFLSDFIFSLIRCYTSIIQILVLYRPPVRDHQPVRIVPCPRHVLDVAGRDHRTLQVLGAPLDKLRAVIGELPFMLVQQDGVAHDGADRRRGYDVRIEAVLVQRLFLFECRTVRHVHRLAERPLDIVVVGRQVEEVLMEELDVCFCLHGEVGL